MTVAINRGLLSRMPSAWFCGGVATIAVVYSKDPILMPLLIAAWVSMMILVGAKNYFNVKLVNTNGGDRLAFNKAKWNRDKVLYFYVVAIVAATTGLALTSDLVFAQPASAGGGCTNLGFLNPLGAYATSVLSGFSGSTTGGGNILDSMCTFIGWILLITVVGGVSAISYFSVQLIQSPGNLGTSIYVLIVPVFFVLGSLAFFAIVGI